MKKFMRMEAHPESIDGVNGINKDHAKAIASDDLRTALAEHKTGKQKIEGTFFDRDPIGNRARLAEKREEFAGIIHDLQLKLEEDKVPSLQKIEMLKAVLRVAFNDSDENADWR